MKKKVIPKNTVVTPVHSVHSMSVREHKTVVLPERASLLQAEHVKKEENHVPGFGIVVNSSSSDVSCNSKVNEMLWPSSK